jgi:hypothetical protein
MVLNKIFNVINFLKDYFTQFYYLEHTISLSLLLNVRAAVFLL